MDPLLEARQHHATPPSSLRAGLVNLVNWDGEGRTYVAMLREAESAADADFSLFFLARSFERVLGETSHRCLEGKHGGRLIEDAPGSSDTDVCVEAGMTTIKWRPRAANGPREDNGDGTRRGSGYWLPFKPSSREQ